MQEAQLSHICPRVSMAAFIDKGRYRAGRLPFGLLEIHSSKAKLMGTRCTGGMGQSELRGTVCCKG